ncbi:MAG TPA: asparagine synthase-related protein [Terriglobales bacterium]|nr:asparagine synthase-related protein [Terriglobales bacterium]
MAICGIAVARQARQPQAEELHSMCQSLATGTAAVQPFSGLAHATLASVAPGSFCSSETLLVACDAELYNDELRESCGSAFSTTTELIGSLYQRYGISFLERLRGAFSVALWDERARQLVLAVDRFGIKRLCYAFCDTEVVFATDPRAIFASGRRAKQVSLGAIVDYFVYNVVPIPQTAFEGVMRVAPGECVVWTPDGVHRQRYWEMRYPEDASGSTGKLARELAQHMEEAVRTTTAGLNPARTGCFLSGGTDSSSILALLTRIHHVPPHAFSIGFAEERFNELEYARIAAKHNQAKHVECLLGPDVVLSTIDKIVAAYDEPFGNSSAIPTYHCAREARERGMEVLLAGDGGDELFGGNERYRTEQIFDLYQAIPRAVRSHLIEPALFKAPPALKLLGKMQRYIRISNTGNPERYCQWRLLRVFPPEQVLGSDMPFRNGHSDVLATVRRHYNSAPAHSELNRLLYVDVKMTLGDDDLPKVVRTAELAGIQVRFPYLDHKLAEFSGRLPAGLKVRHLEKRYLFKQATRDLLPAAILHKRKHGFGLPIGFWLKVEPRLHAWAQDVLLDPRTYQRGYFRREFIETLFVRMQQDDTPYFGDLLWVFLMLELWHRQHVERGAC